MDQHDKSATLRVEQAAQFLGISRNLAYELARTGKLPGARRLGRRIVVSRKAVEDFLAGSEKVGQELRA